MVLVATDEVGQTGRSKPVTLVLPARSFSNPIARAVVEQRRMLALDAGKAPHVADMIDAITIDPAKYENSGAYLSLRAAYHRLTGARSDEDLVSVVDFLWEIALGLEDGDMSLAAEDLRAAQERLREAIENNASDAELEKAMQELREAMNRYLEALSRPSQQNPQENRQQQADRNTRTLTQQDLQKMMDQIENLARSGFARGGAADALRIAADDGEPASGPAAPGAAGRGRPDEPGARQARRHDPPTAGADGQDLQARSRTPTAAARRRRR